MNDGTRFTCYECGARWDGPEIPRTADRTKDQIIRCPRCGETHRLGGSPISKSHARGWTYTLQEKK